MDNRVFRNARWTLLSEIHSCRLDPSYRFGAACCTNDRLRHERTKAGVNPWSQHGRIVALRLGVAVLPFWIERR
jgi:hypothetical protein